MNVSELMIGDLVRVTNGIAKVHDIGNIVGVEFIDGGYDVFKIEELEPIPLTPEILEKNGFEKTQIHGEKQDDIFQCFDGEIIIEVGTYDPNFILIHYRYETPDGINSGELSSIVKVDGGKFYLHELQHALKLCGIEKNY